MLITVVETTEFTAQAKAEGMTRADIDAAILQVAANPTGGESLGAGLYKVRVARAGGGKSGGYRVVTLFFSMNTPLLLIAVLAKKNRKNFSTVEVKDMKKGAKSRKRKA